MTLEQIMGDTSLSNWGKAQEILALEGDGGEYTVCSPDDIYWEQNGTRFRSLRAAKAYASLSNAELASPLAVLGPDATWHDVGDGE